MQGGKGIAAARTAVSPALLFYLRFNVIDYSKFPVVRFSEINSRGPNSRIIILTSFDGSAEDWRFFGREQVVAGKHIAYRFALSYHAVVNCVPGVVAFLFSLNT